MTSEWHRYLPDEVSSAAARVEAGGEPEFAWLITAASSVLQCLKEAGYAVLGGDMYNLDGSDFVPAHASWSCNLEPGENWQAFVTRSSSEAARYLSAYQHPANLWFSPVAIGKPDAAQLARIYAR